MSEPSDLSDPSDIQVVEQIYVALAAKDVMGLLELIDPSIVLVQDERLPWGGRHEGHDGLANFALTLGAHIDSAVDTIAMFGADGDVIQMGYTRGTTVESGTRFDVAEVHRWTVRDGKAVAAHFSIDTDAMLQALGA